MYLREAECYMEDNIDLESHLGSEDKLLCDLGQVSRPLDLSFLSYRIYIEMTAATAATPAVTGIMQWPVSCENA